MKTLIKNATIISMDSSRNQIEKNMDILIENDKITQISSNINIQEDEIKIIDATNKVVLPGLINTHSHIPMSIFRETIGNCDLQEWLTQKIWPMEDKLTEEDIYYSTLLSSIEMIETGCTTINDMYFVTDAIIKAAKETGIRLQTTRTLMDMVSEEEGESRFKELLRLMNEYKDEPNITFNAGLHSLYTTNEPYVKKSIKFAQDNNLLVHMHFCENSKEVEDVRKMYNSEPIEVLKRNFQNVPTLLAHVVKVNDEDLKCLKEMNMSVAHCPISNLKLGCGIANITEMLKLGINVSLGTDGQGSASNLNLFETMRAAALLQKGIHENPTVIPSYEVLKMATINGAKALGLEDKIGSITEGKQADIIILDLEKSMLKPENDLISQIVYNADGRDVETTIIAGKVLMENGKLCNNIDKSQLYKKCDEIINRIK